MKFGGKSLSSPEKVQKICKNIKKIYKNNKKIIIIVSAIGSTTDNLLQISKNYYQKSCPKRELDVLLSTGETQSSALFAMTLNSCGVPAKSFQAFQINLSTFGDFQNSKISYINKKPILDCINSGCVAVISGFQGINNNNEITTLGRGGSDTTAAALGAIFDCDVEIYSDFDGIFAGDPRELKFKKLKNIDYTSAIKGAESGAKVLDSRAIEIAKKYNFNIICKQSPFINSTGTIVSDIENPFVSISSVDNLCKITLNFLDGYNLYFIVKNVLNSLKNYKYYNLTINSCNISFLISINDKLNILNKISEKLKLLKK